MIYILLDKQYSIPLKIKRFLTNRKAVFAVNRQLFSDKAKPFVRRGRKVAGGGIVERRAGDPRIKRRVGGVFFL